MQRLYERLAEDEKSWYLGLDEAGRSIYAYTQNGVVKGAGYATMSAEQMVSKYNL